MMTIRWRSGSSIVPRRSSSTLRQKQIGTFCCARSRRVIPFLLLNTPVIPFKSDTYSSYARMVTREVLGSGLRLITETMPHVRSVSIGVWLTRGSRHESEARSGIAHVVEHMLFKGTASRTAEDIAQAIDSIGGQLDAFTAKEYAAYYIKVLDEHLPLAVDLLSDIVMNPKFEP